MIDTKFDYRSDSNGKDPDSASQTLRGHHQTLWSKPLPSGQLFSLEKMSGKYLVHRSGLGEFSISSDTITNSFRSNKKLAQLIAQISPEDLDAFQGIGSTTGARIIFPGNRVDGKATLNVARGFSSQIGDRFDLSLECIRLHYLNKASPLESTLFRYRDFFGLFESFEGYVDFFLLNDLASNSKVNFFLPFEAGFSQNPRPTTKQDYMEYMKNSMSFVTQRNERINLWSRNYPLGYLDAVRS
jgi:hypothetical protein